MRKLEAVITALIFSWLPPMAGALDIPFGPVDNPPGIGAVGVGGDAALSFTGTTVQFLGLDLSKTKDLYFGVQADAFKQGFSADGVEIGPTEIFRFESATENSITFAASTLFVTDAPNFGSWTIPTRITYTFTGPGEIVADFDTISLNDEDNGDVTALWHVQGDFFVNIKVETQVTPNFDPFLGNWEPGNFFVNRTPSLPESPLAPNGIATATSYDWGFYYSLEDVVPPAVEPTQIPTMGPLGLGVLFIFIAETVRRRLKRRERLNQNRTVIV